MNDAVKEIFVDTPGWLALEDSSDPAGATTTRESNRLLQEGYQFVTTNFVLDEVFTILKARVGHSAAVRFGEKIRTSTLVAIIIVGPGIEDEAWRTFEREPGSGASFTDFVSWTVMRRRRIRVALTNDPAYAAAGFEALPSLHSRVGEAPEHAGHIGQ